MNKEQVVLGIDTSNYTTSLAMMNLNGKLIRERRELLFVKDGMVGLRQSEALFQHIKAIPLISKTITDLVSSFNFVAVSSAVKPRPLEDSYMPVFVAAESFGSTISSLLDIPFYGFSHQEGHIKAGLWSLGLEFDEPFLALHISGGTTEFLEIKHQKSGYKIKILGGTSDISAGQFIDRIGVKMNLPFPAGVHMENLLNEGALLKDINIPVSVKDRYLSFSGPETYIQKRLKEDIKASDVAYSVFLAIGKSLYGLIKNIMNTNGYKDILVVGGVASNKIIKNYLEDQLQAEGINIYFGIPKYCSDNAVGIAALGVESYINQKNKQLT